jgi:hypothetical protein
MDAKRFDTLLATLAAAPSRRAALRLLGGLGLAGRFGQTAAKKKKEKKCAKAGQPTSKKRKKCCKGLVKDGSRRCAQPASSPPCVPRTCAANGCGRQPDGCGGILSCGGCPTNQICLISGVCQPCSVTCTGTPAQCGTTLQAVLNNSNGGTVYICPGTYQHNFALANLPNGVTLIGAGEGDNSASNTILDAAGAGRVLNIFIGVGPVALARLRFTGGNTSTGGGAGIHHDAATLRMTECTVSGNTTVNKEGAGIAVSGNGLEMTRCTVRLNHATGENGVGGGISTLKPIILTDCLIEDNHADSSGGGIYCDISVGTTTLAGSTRVRRNAADIGGGIFVGAFGGAGALVIAETCRVTANMAIDTGSGGGIYRSNGTVTLQGASPSPIVVNNCYDNCFGLIPVPKCAALPVSCPP